MPETPEDKARKTIDDLLAKACWLVQDRDKANVPAGRGVAIRGFPLKAGHGFADYLLYVDGQTAGVIEAKKEGEPLTTYEIQTAKNSEGLADGLATHRRPLPFCYQSAGVETRFTNLLDPDSRIRQVFAFHRRETFAKWLQDEAKSPQVDRLDDSQRQPVLDFARRLMAPEGTPGRELVRFAGTIDPADLEAMSRAIQEGCEAVNAIG
jgi:type I restriction enzyme, R subunit